jgi:hypothetical protein
MAQFLASSFSKAKAQEFIARAAAFMAADAVVNACVLWKIHLVGNTTWIAMCICMCITSSTMSYHSMA